MKRKVKIGAAAVVALTAGMGCSSSDDTSGNGSADAGSAQAALQQMATGLTQPLALTSAGDDSGRLFIVDQVGTIRILQDGALQSQPFLDLRDKLIPLQSSYDERGLLGLAFHPQFADNGRFFVFYSAPLRASAPAGYDHTNVLSEFRVGADGMADASSERVLLQHDHPYLNHNGGTLAFGRDGLLYLSLGDGGNKNDIGTGHPPLGNGQDITTLLGSILRIDPDGAAAVLTGAATGGSPDAGAGANGAYGIPADNPFVGGDGAGEIYAYGFRNPYRFSFDRQTGELYAADVGQNLMEEVDLVEKGKDYGWNIKEGTLCFNPDQETAPPTDCADTGPRGEPLVAPLMTYLHPSLPDSVPDAVRSSLQDVLRVGIAVVGGYVYRGPDVPGLQGHYVFGDWSSSQDTPSGVLLDGQRSGSGWMLQPLELTSGAASSGAGGALSEYLLGFGEDERGSLYVLSSKSTGPAGNSGSVWKLVSP